MTNSTRPFRFTSEKSLPKVDDCTSGPSCVVEPIRLYTMVTSLYLIFACGKIAGKS